MREKKKRHITKSFTWRIFATAISISLVYYITENLALASFVGLMINFVKMILYYVHERIWERTDWGRER